MALTATASQGFEQLRLVEPDEVMYVMGDPGVTYNRGTILINALATAGASGVVSIPGAALHAGGVVGTVQETTICAAAATLLPLPSSYVPREARLPDVKSSNLSLIPVRPNVPAGEPVYLVTFVNHLDEAVASYDGPNRNLVITTGPGADDRANGAFVYIYAGTGAGQHNVIEDYTHSSVTCLLHRPFAVAPDNTSKVIILCGEASTFKGVGYFGRVDTAGTTGITVDVADGADDGEFMVYADYRTIAKYLSELKLPVVKKQPVLSAVG